MTDMTLRVLGCGDAFCSGGRLQTCFHLQTGEHTLLLDCGATTPLAMQQQGIDPSSIDLILVSHLHGDHFGGVPFLLIQAEFVARRTKPLTIIGPRGTRARIAAAIAVLFSDLKDTVWRFPLDVIEIEAGDDKAIGGLLIATSLVDHPSGAPSLAYRLQSEGKILAFSGDTRWTEALVDIADGADLMIMECHRYRPNGVHHMDWQTLTEEKHRLRAKRFLLTHMSDDMLSRVPSLQADRIDFAEDGFATTV